MKREGAGVNGEVRGGGAWVGVTAQRLAPRVWGTSQPSFGGRESKDGHARAGAQKMRKT